MTLVSSDTYTYTTLIMVKHNNNGTGHKTPISKPALRPLSRNKKIINPNRINDGKDKSSMRSRATINRLAMYKSRAKHDKYGNFLHGDYMSKTTETPVQRIAPNRKWFGNTRIIDQKQLTQFRNDMNIVNNDKYQVVMKPSTLPMSLLNNPFNNTKINILQNETYNNIINKSRIKRKHIKLQYSDYSSLMQHNQTASDTYNVEHDINHRDKLVDRYTAVNHKNNEKKLFEKGQSKRIWSELYKVIDSSDIVIQVLDARDPLGTRCQRIEDELQKSDRKHKQLIFILNKCDLIPTYVTRKWVKYLSGIAPTIAFHASITNSFGKGTLINLLRQFSILHSDKQQISCGFVGMPNVGKSSIINTLRGKQVCKAAPVPGQTKVWQYITLFKRIFLIDSPGVVHITQKNDDSDSNTVLRGVIRIENLANPHEYIHDVLKLIKPQYIATAYGITAYTSVDNFLDQYARITGKLLKGGEPDTQKVARMILNDFQRGKLPYYMIPPNMTNNGDDSDTTINHNSNTDTGIQVEQLYNKIHVKHNFNQFTDLNNSLGDNIDNISNDDTTHINDSTEITDWDAEYDGIEGSEVDESDAEHVLGIEHSENENDVDDDDSYSHIEHSDTISDNDNDDTIDEQNNIDNSTTESNNDIDTRPITNDTNKTKRRRFRKRGIYDDTIDQYGNDIATKFISDPIQLVEKQNSAAGNEKQSRQSLNKAKKKRQMAKRKRLRVCQ